jgi:hypothetical protein
MADHIEKPVNSSDDDNLDGKTEYENRSLETKPSHPDNLDTDDLRHNINAKIANPLAGFTHAQRTFSSYRAHSTMLIRNSIPARRGFCKATSSRR